MSNRRLGSNSRINLKTARALGLTIPTAKALGVTIPPSLLLRADQVIE